MATAKKVITLDGLSHFLQGLIQKMQNDGYVKDKSYKHTDNNYTSTDKNKLAGISANANRITATSQIKNDSNFTTIDKVTEAGFAKTSSLPTKVSQLSNDSGFITKSAVPTNNNQLSNGKGYQTKSEVSAAISSAIATAYKYKGTVATRSKLPSSASIGDMYNIEDTGMNTAWNGKTWDDMAPTVNLDGYWNDKNAVEASNSDIDAMF